MYNKNGAHGTCWAPSKAAYGMGLFKLLIGLLVARKKLVALAVVAIGTLVVSSLSVDRHKSKHPLLELNIIASRLGD